MTPEITSLLKQINIEVEVILKEQTSQVAVRNATVCMTRKDKWKVYFSKSLLTENIPSILQHRPEYCKLMSSMDPGQSERDI